MDGGEGAEDALSSPSASLFLHLLNLSSFDGLSKEARKRCFSCHTDCMCVCTLFVC